MSLYTWYYVFIIFLFCGLNDNLAVGNTGTFRTPSTNNDQRISGLQSEILKIQSEILTLSSSLSSGGNSEDIKTRLSSIENEFERLKQQLNDERRESSAADGKYDGSIAVLTNYYNTLDKTIKELQASMESKAQEESSRRMPADIAEEIRSHRFSEAEALLIKMNDNAKIPKIVHDVYANSQGNTDVLLDFVKALTKIDLSCYVLSALRYEMRANGHNDPFKMMALAKALEKEVLFQRNGGADVKAKAQTVLNETLESIESTATQILKSAMYTNNYQNNVDVENLANAIDDFRRETSDRVMERVVKEAYSTVSAVKIAENIYSNKYIPQIVSGLIALFNQMESNNALNNQAVLNIGDYLKRVKSMKNYKNINADKKQAVDTVFSKMPTCARNLFEAPSVCIWNKGKGEYLYAATSPYNYNKDRRSIFTWSTGEAVIQGVWYPEKIGEDIYFKNKAHGGEFMYAAAVDPYNKNNHYVLTWVDGGYFEDKSAWIIELDGDYCYLRSRYFSEYLYASEKWHSDKRRYVFTWIPGTGVRKNSDFQWQIRGCI